MKRTMGLLALIALLASCSNLFSKNEATHGTLVVSFASGARTVGADLQAVDSYEVTLTSQDGYATRLFQVNWPATSVTVSPLEAGLWDLAVVVMRDGLVVSTASASDIEILPGTTPKVVSLSFNFEQTGGTAGIALELRFPSSVGIDYVEGSIAGSLLEPPLVELTGADAGFTSVTFIKSDIMTTGSSQDLNISFRTGGNIAATFTEAVNLWNNVTSDKWIDDTGAMVAYKLYEAGDFLDANTSLADLVISGVELAFSSSTPDYGEIIIPNRDTVSFRPSGSIPGQVIEYEWNYSGTWLRVPTGTDSAELVLDHTSRILTVRVSALDGTSSDYTVPLRKGFTLIYDGNLNTGGAVPVDGSVYAAGTVATVSGNTGLLERMGYTFDGWCSNPDGTGMNFAADQDITVDAFNLTLFARWIKNGTVEVTFDIPDLGVQVLGFNPPSLVISSDDITSNPDMAFKTSNTALQNIEGWKWYVDNVLDETQSGTSDFRLSGLSIGQHLISAVLTLDGKPYSGSLTITIDDSERFSITYDDNGATYGIPPTDPNLYRSGKWATVLGNGTLSKPDWFFAGWNTAADGSGTAYAPNDILVVDTANVTLYAQWEGRVLVVGNNGPSNSLWQNGEERTLPLPGGLEGEAYLDGITHAGGHTYIVGSGWNVWQGSGGWAMQPLMWKDGVVVPMPSIDGHAYASSVAASGSDWWVAGHSRGYSSEFPKVYLWKNSTSEPLILDTGSFATVSTSIALVGTDVYVTGDYNGEAVYWKIDADNNVTRTDLVDPFGGGNDAVANAIAISDTDDVWVAGTVNPDGSQAVVWKNGVVVPPFIGEYGDPIEANAIWIDGSDVYIAGQILGEGYQAALWKFDADSILTTTYLPGGDNALDVVVDNNQVYVVGSSSFNGAILWKNEVQQVLGGTSANGIFIRNE